jgi:hypothetical protein
MKQYRVYFKKNGINLTKLVYADSLSEIYLKFKDSTIIKVICLDKDEEEDEENDED